MKISPYKFILIFLILLSACKQKSKNLAPTGKLNEGAVLVQQAVAAMGGIENYRQLNDLSLTYTYKDTIKGVQDVSTEKFLYEGELGWAEYHEHTKNVFPDKEGPVTQAWDGKKGWVIVEGNFVNAPPALKMVRFARNTIFFWTNMMYKMLDPGIIYERLPNRTFEDKEYHIVKITYEENIGDAQDEFILYINPKTKLIDQFLFSNMFFGVTEPRMTQVKYKEVGGLKWPAYRRYRACNWEGVLKPDTYWVEQISTDIKVNNGFNTSIVEKPILYNVPLADIRNNFLKKGISSINTEKGKALINLLEEACGGYSNWRNYKEASFTQTADWYENETNWTTNPQEFKMVCELGSSNGKLTLLNGPYKGNSWKLKNSAISLIKGEETEGQLDMAMHKQTYKSYWFQFPFKIREAGIISYAGKKKIKETEYDIVYATWNSEGPNSKYDQYMLYLHPETHQLEWLEFTIRDIFPIATGFCQFTNYKKKNGIELPLSQFVTQGTLNKPLKKLHENHYQDFQFN